MITKTDLLDFWNQYRPQLVVVGIATLLIIIAKLLDREYLGGTVFFAVAIWIINTGIDKRMGGDDE